MSEEQFKVSDFTVQAVQATLEWFQENGNTSVNTDAEAFLSDEGTAAFMEVYTQLVANSILNTGENESDS